MQETPPGAPEDHPDGDDGRDRWVEAAYAAERATGRHEETDDDVRRSLAMRWFRMMAGFVVIGIGVTLLALPGPGWLMIVLGLSLLPFRWAERTISTIRRKIPGVPEDGSIPARTWVVIGAVTVAAVVGSFLFGDAIGSWASDTWATIWS